MFIIFIYFLDLRKVKQVLESLLFATTRRLIGGLSDLKKCLDGVFFVPFSPVDWGNEAVGSGQKVGKRWLPTFLLTASDLSKGRLLFLNRPFLGLIGTKNISLYREIFYRFSAWFGSLREKGSCIFSY